MYTVNLEYISISICLFVYRVEDLKRVIRHEIEDGIVTDCKWWYSILHIAYTFSFASKAYSQENHFTHVVIVFHYSGR